jgi:hypothetical protein
MLIKCVEVAARVLAEMGNDSFSGRSPSRRARAWSIMLSSAPESTRMVMEWEPEGSRNSPERLVLLGEAGTTMELASMPPFTGELWLLLDTG